jgi:hypothetical protein
MAAAADIPAQIAALQAQIAALQAQLPAQSEETYSPHGAPNPEGLTSPQIQAQIEKEYAEMLAEQSMTEAVERGLSDEVAPLAPIDYTKDISQWELSDEVAPKPKVAPKPEVDTAAALERGAEATWQEENPLPDAKATAERGAKATKEEYDEIGAAPKERRTDDAKELGYPLDDVLETAIGADSAVAAAAPDQALLDQLFLDAHNSPFDPASDVDAGKMVSIQELLASGQDFGDLAADEEARTRFALQLYRQ